MRFCVLGPLEAYERGRAVAIGGGRQRALLALLLVHAGEIVSRDKLIDELWSGDPPAGASQSLDVYVSRVRKAMRRAGAEGVLATRSPGYVLHAEETDAAQFEAQVGAGRAVLAAGDYDRAASVLRDGLALWRGNAYVEVADEPWARPEVERLEELRLAAMEDRIDAELALGRHGAVVPELELLAGRHPTRERLVGQLMLALYRCGRQADALSAYRATRSSLVEQLGLEPGPELRRVEAAVLAQDAALELPRLPSAESRPVEKRPPGLVAPEGERKQVTVLFADFPGSMDLAEQVDPEELRRIMERFLSIVGAGVHLLGGTVDKFTGDGIMALFGAPIAHEDHARRACYAALHLKQELTSYEAELRARGLRFSVRMGLNSGEAVVGPIGEDTGLQYTAIGHTVALAQRIEQLAEPGSVYLTQSTASLAEGYFALRDLGEFAVKGASHPVRVHELIGVGAARGALDVARARGLTPFVGRTRELRALQDALDEAFAGKGQLIGVVGEAGVGKSRLCHEFAELQRANGIPVYRVAGQAHAKAVPLMPVLDFLRTYFEIAERESDTTARERIAARLLNLDADFDHDLPLIFEFLAVPDPDRPAERMDPEARQRRLLAFMKRLTRAQGAHEPVVTVIEDLNWLDSASEAFLANHVDAIQGARGLTIVNFRPEYHAPWMSRSYYRQIALGPLGAQAVQDMLFELLGSDPSLTQLVELVRKRTQGNPFFIEELVRSLVEAGTLEGERGAYRLIRALEQAAVPPSVHAVLAARIDRLAPRDKTLLQAAAVIGKEFPQPVLEQVVELDATELDDALHDLIANEFVYEQDVYPEPIFAFKHPLSREVAYRSQLAERRTALHAAVARATIAHYPERLDERAALLAQHWEAAGETLESARWHARAAAWSGTSDPIQALRHWRKMCELADSLPDSAETVALRLQARVSLLNYSWRVGISHEEAEALFNDAERMASEVGDVRARVLLLAGYGGVRKVGEGDDRGGARLQRQAIALAEESGEPALRVAVSLFAYPLLCIGEYREGVAICDRAIELADSDPTVGAGIVLACPYANCHVFKGVFMTPLGELEEARRLLQHGRELAHEHGDIEVVGWSHMWSVWLAYFLGAPEAALGHGQEGVEIAERIGGSFSRAVAWLHLGGAELMRREWQRAIDALERSLAIARERHYREHDGWRLTLLGESYLGLGDVERARALVAEGLEIAHERGNRFEETHANLALTRVTLGSADPAARPEIETAIAHALELAQNTGAKAFEPLIHVEIAELMYQSGDLEERERELRKAHRLFIQIGATGHAERLAAELQLPSR
jgi:class 3 adenylate cyclase/tetratricopeptide (TPR) repeat protein